MKKIVIKSQNGIMPMIKNRIDKMPYAEMLRHYKSPSNGSILFQGKHRDYFVKVMGEKKSKLDKTNVQAIGSSVLKKVYNSF